MCFKTYFLNYVDFYEKISNIDIFPMVDISISNVSYIRYIVLFFVSKQNGWIFFLLFRYLWETVQYRSSEIYRYQISIYSPLFCRIFIETTRTKWMKFFLIKIFLHPDSSSGGVYDVTVQDTGPEHGVTRIVRGCPSRWLR